MKVKFAVVLMLVFSTMSFGQWDKEPYRTESLTFQVEQNVHYLNKKTSPLPRKDRKKFKGHEYFSVSLDYIVKATFERVESPDTIEMVTSSGIIKYYFPYAKMVFELNGESCELMSYQSLRLRKIDEYKDYIFVPFRDATSGKESYGGGRYLDLKIPAGNEIILNFNKAYNPYCAYTVGYNCTIPPKENTLAVKVKAGLKAPDLFH